MKMNPGFSPESLEPARVRVSLPVVLANTSLCVLPSEIMAASPAGARSKVRVPEEVNCPEGDTVTVGRTSRCFRLDL